MEKIIKVAHNSEVNGLAGSIAISLRDDGKASVQAIGSEAVNQAIKAIITARRFLSPNNQDLVVTPSFAVLQLDDGEKTAIKFFIKVENIQ